MPRYVVLTHDHPELHWDLMLECGETLRTWRLAAPPAEGENIPAEAIADHRKLYLDYEGPVSHNRGHVTRWDAGVYEGELAAGDEIEIAVDGEKLRGTIRLSRQNDERAWSLQFVPRR